MKVITLKDAKPGMRLAKPVTDAGGAMLLQEGVELSPEWIHRLKTRRVDSICIEDASAPLSVEDREKAFAAIDADIDHMFADVIGNEVMKLLAEYAKQFLKSKVK